MSLKQTVRIASPLLLLATLAACASFPYDNPNPSGTPEQQVTQTPVATADASQPETTTRQTLRVWLPAAFDPAADTPAAILLQARLDEFRARRPNLKVEVRIKAPDGTAGLLNALTSASQAAPSVLPDLVALPLADLEIAAVSGIIHPIDGLTTLIDDPDWFNYARELSHIQNTAYGIPFAADMLTLLYRDQSDGVPIANWESFNEENTLLVAADDPQAFFSLCLYLDTETSLYNETGQPTLDEARLTETLAFYQNDFLAPDSAQYQTGQQVLDAYRAQNHLAAVVWASQILEEMPADSALAPIPGLEEKTCSLATGWLWALAGASPEMQPVAVELAEFLSDSQFLAAWTEAAGLLPPRPTALDAWPKNNINATLQEVSRVATPVPAVGLLQTLGPILRDAAIATLQEQVSPSAAAQTALESLQ